LRPGTLAQVVEHLPINISHLVKTTVLAKKKKKKPNLERRIKDMNQFGL
jgi:hypothetical protein